ncbi:MAG: hypothetical protein K9J37_04365 [Saprospiraceae bacterium]|nr:hypothetical protein [Saprospiraceae bacterium]MCF8249119.1 hypothetical protein [Saprospiraceae bacterium]MCF8281376.1 hypothetical protein [Bacteroidales bacterium]MCF8311141.1 hypothetical protein [Saprospiraceae bacterium]MCF8440231.1 hypothetical protein [Saprospiraceae bacterium]
MENILSPYFTWWHLIHTAVWLVVIFLVLKLLSRWLALGRIGGATMGGRFQRSLQPIVEKILLLFEPLVALSLGTVFVFIDPVLYGTIVLVLMIAGFSSLKNYINGRFILLNNSVANAKRIKTKDGEGIIARRGRLGLYLQTGGGLRHIPYSILMDSSFTLISGENMERFWRVQMAPKEAEEATPKKLLGMLASSPYLDKNHLPELSHFADGQIEAKLLFLHERYLSDFVQVMGELGWECNVKN